MLITYILALAFITILLFSAVHLHFSFGLHRGLKAKVKVKVAVSHVERTPNLHEEIFRKY
jgi:hypothetical protein